MATGWRLREEGGESGVTKSGTGRGGERTERENAGELSDQDNRHSEWYRD